MIIGVFVAVTWAIGMGLLVFFVKSIMLVFFAIMWTLVCCGLFELIDDLLHRFN